jgi:hypothetical protein
MGVQFKPYTIAANAVVGKGATNTPDWCGCDASELSGWQAAVDHRGRGTRWRGEGGINMTDMRNAEVILG